MIRLILASLVLCAAHLAHAADTASEIGQHSANSLTCDLQPVGMEAIEFKCSVGATGAVQRLRFRADFVGSHDDTNASMKTSLNGTPIVCNEGSKTTTMGEFGEVSLDCTLSVKQPAGTRLVLGVTLQFYHAQYVDADFVSE